VKIERINRIKDYRIFHNFSWTGELSDFSRFNLIYGWNGSGKTTLSNLFTYLQKRQDISRGDVKFQVDGSVINGSVLSESVIPQVRVFNRDTVSRSLFEVPNHELEPVFYLGEDSAEKQERIEELKIESNTYRGKKKKSIDKVASAKVALDNFCKNKAAEIKALLTSAGGGPYNNYNKAGFSIKCDQLLAFESAACLLLPAVYDEYLVTKNGVALDKIEPITINLPDYLGLNKQVTEFLKKSVVTNVISELADDPHVASWVQNGLAVHDVEKGNTQCRFCTNEVSAERIKALESHFNDQLTAFQNEIDSLIVILEQAIKSIEGLALPSDALFYPRYKETYKKKITVWTSTKSTVTLYLYSLINALKTKRNQPFKEMDLVSYASVSVASDQEKSTLMKVFGLLVDGAQAMSVALGLSALESINRIVGEHNAYTDNFKAEVDKSRRVLEVHTVSSYIEEYKSNKDNISACEEDLSNKNDKLVASEAEIALLEREIKEFVKPVEELNKDMSDYLGRDELKFEIKDNGYVITRNGYPAMNLSEGERTAIAFMYFLKTLEDTDFDMTNGVVVIDDPISSLDANSMYSAFGFMKARTKGVNQLFVLTHSFAFFRHVRKWFFQEPKLPATQGRQGSNDYRTAARFYMLDAGVGEGVRSSSIKNIDPLLRDYESEYQYIFKKVHDFANGGAAVNLESYYGIPNIARRLLETFLTFKMPNVDAGKIEKKLDAVSFDTVKKTRILRFLHVHSHYDQVGEPEHDLSLLAEAPAVLNDLIDLIKTVDREHYDGMVSFFEPETEDVGQVVAEVEGES
jgi:wobble nucleotide-excising tRNase